jgi:hypothetical protein
LFRFPSTNWKLSTSDAACSGHNRATAQPRNSAGNSFAENQVPSGAASVSAFSSFFDSQPSTFNPHQSLHHCTPASASPNGAVRFLNTIIKEWAVFTTLCFVYFVFSTDSASANITNSMFSAFSAEGSVSTETFEEGKSDPIRTFTGHFLFSYSNNIWEIQISSQKGQGLGIDPALLAKQVLDCKRIPDGVRFFVALNTNLYSIQTNPVTKDTPGTIATAEATPFPPPEQVELLTCWLTFCPYPDLPTIDSTHARGMLPVKVLNNPNNIGSFSKTYLEPDHVFLSEYQFTNNGTLIAVNLRAIKMPKPFDRGFLAQSFRVLETTNINGVTFPSLAANYQFMPRLNATNRTDVYPGVITQVKLDRIEIGTLPVFSKPILMFALDRRPTNLPDTPQWTYSISNDSWPATTNPKVVAFANIVREHGNTLTTTRDSRQLVVRVILGILLLGLPVYLLSRKLRSRK